MALTRLLCILGSLELASAAHAEIAVIVNAGLPVRSMTTQQVAELYLGRTRSFESNQYALIFDRPGDDPLRERFFRAATSMSPAQVNAFWSRLKFTGRVQPPQPLPGDAATIDMVGRNPNAIGYIGATTVTDPQVRIVLILHE